MATEAAITRLLAEAAGVFSAGGSTTEQSALVSRSQVPVVVVVPSLLAHEKLFVPPQIIDVSFVESTLTAALEPVQL